MQPEIYSAQSYDALKIIALAIKRGNSFTADSIRNQLYKIQNYDGVSGITSFNKNGDVNKPAIIKFVKNQNFLFWDNK